DAVILTGAIAGEADSDTLALSLYTTPIQAALTASDASNGFDGKFTGNAPNPVSAGFTGLNVLNAGSGANTLNRRNANSTWPLGFESAGSTANAPTLLTFTGVHGLTDGEAVRYSSAGGDDAHGLTNGSIYYVVLVGLTEIRLQTTRGDLTTLVTDPDPTVPAQVQIAKVTPF